MLTIPASAERLSIFDVLKPKRVKSRYAPTVQAIHYVLACPTCNTEHPAIMGGTAHCDCGLSMHYGFGGVDIWRADECVKNGERVDV